jgi:hypothetical protein
MGLIWQAVPACSPVALSPFAYPTWAATKLFGYGIDGTSGTQEMDGCLSLFQ